MGYEVPRRMALLKFEDGVHDGLEVRCAFDMPLGTFIEFTKRMGAEAVVAQEEAIRQWADDILDSWNVEEKGKPVPASADGVMVLGLAFVKDIIDAWAGGMKDSVTGPLAETTADLSTSSVNGGAASPAESSEKTLA